MIAKLIGGPFDGKELETRSPEPNRVLIPVGVTGWSDKPQKPQVNMRFVAVKGDFAEYEPEAKAAS